MAADWQSALDRARAHSPFLQLALERRPELAAIMAEGHGAQALAAAKASGEGIGDTGLALRRERLSLALVLAIGDLAGDFPLNQVMGELSDFADRALDAAMLAAVQRRVPGADTRGFFGLALGEARSAGELNYSSDIDPILLFDPETIARAERDEPGEAAQRYARQVVEMLSTPTGEGYVARVDLRLRPASEVSPLAVPVGGAISHYESSALAWERAAYIRARSAAGDLAAGEQFLDDIRPFVWRKSIDFTAIEEIRRLTARIRSAYKGPLEPGPGFDVKKGRGGIREIEFYAQTHQLIYGGRDPALRCRGTREALDALAQAGVIKAEDAQILGISYDRLRVIEHRLQMIDDRQTHELPASEDAITNVAKLEGLADGAALVDELRDVCGAVAARYDELLGDDDTQGPAVSVPGSYGAKFDERVEHWRGTIRALRSTEARKAFDAIRPDLLQALADAPDPDKALARWETFLSRLPTAINLFRLFEERPGLLDRVLRVLTLSQPLADELARRPESLDVLIDANALGLPGSREALSVDMARSEEGDYEARLDRLRQVVGEERFALGVQLIEARHDPLDIAEGLCRVAEAAIATGAEAALAEFRSVHGAIADSELVVLGLGRLGGGALTHASDLDIVYLFTGGFGGESDGRRPLSATLYYNRLAARVTAALSVPTAEGALYEIDTRLRPQGKQGPLAVSLAAFEQYQREDAWTWEHMALTRARPLYGSGAAKEKLAGIINNALRQERDPAALRADVLKMRADVLGAKPPQGPLDVKLLRGGLVDSEFLIHYLQLREGIGLEPAVETACASLAGAGLLPAEHARNHLTLTRFLAAERLFAPDGGEPSDAAKPILAQACGHPSYSELLQSLVEARQGIAEQWQVHFNEKLEISQ